MNNDTANLHRPTLSSVVIRCLGNRCTEAELCARYRDRMTGRNENTKCVTNLMNDQGYPCHAFISTWLSLAERDELTKGTTL